MNKFYVTTPIYYVNSYPHLGHVYTTIIADTVARYKRQRGNEVFFLTGTDEHGINIERAAENAGVPVKQHVDRIVDSFKTAFAPFQFTNRHWVRTTDKYHEEGVRKLWQKAKDNGWIYKGKYEGWYCGNCNEFYQEAEAVKGEGDTLLCPTHERPLDLLSEESYFFKLSAFQDKLIAHYEANPHFIRPETRRNEVLSFVRGGLNDLAVSRVSVKWGIPVPDDPEHTMYVWFDALSNYITAIGYGNNQFGGEEHFNKFWPADLQLVGKDILRFHTVYWPAFLMAAGLPLPKTVYSHGMWLSGGRKMSKTLGNVIDLAVLHKHFTPEVVRYFVLREMVFGQDGDFTYEALLDRVNADLASGLGNLAARTLTMVRNFCEGVIPAAGKASDELTTQAAEVRDAVAQAVTAFDREFDEYNFSRAIEAVSNARFRVDKFISDAKPWDLAKDPAKRGELELVLHTASESLRFFAALLAPVLPNATQAIWQQLGESGEVDAIGGRHRDYFTALAAELDAPSDSGHSRRLTQAEIEIDNLRAAFAWSIENAEPAPALRLATSLQPLWFSRWRHREGVGWLDAALSATTDAVPEPDRIRALADKALLLSYGGFTEGAPAADDALRLARENGDPALVMRALVAHGRVYAHAFEVAAADFHEAGTLARELDDRWRLSHILGWQAIASMTVGDHAAIAATAHEGCALADAIGDESNARLNRLAMAAAPTYRGEVARAIAPLRDVLAEATAAHDLFCRSVALLSLTFALAWHGDVEGALGVADEYVVDQADTGEFVEDYGYSALGLIKLMAGDATAAHEAYEAALLRTPLTPATVSTYVLTAIPMLLCGDVAGARKRADEVVAMSTGVSLVPALAARARVGIALGDMDQAELDAREALEVAAESHGHMLVADTLECLAQLAIEAMNLKEGARLLGAAEGARQQSGVARFKVYQSEYENILESARERLGDSDFRNFWDEGSSLTIEEAIAYVRRGRGERRRASSGWSALTRAELEVVQQVKEGLPNKDIAARLFISPRTVQAHLTHIYTKLGLTSRVQLAQEATRRG